MSTTTEAERKYISEEQLVDYLCMLRNMLQQFDYDSIKNIIFLNMEAFYLHINKHTVSCCNESVGEIMSIIEPYIPLTLCIDDDILEIFFKLSLCSADDELEKLEKSFYERVRMDFLNTVRNADHPMDWDTIVFTCLAIRKALLG